MIPFSVPSLWFILLYALGAVGMVILPLWALWLWCSPKARARLKRRWWPSALLAAVLGFSTFVFAHTQYRMKQIRLEIEAEEAARQPTLTEPATLAGIEMPAGTKLVLPSRNAVGAAYSQAPYFEEAEFPQPVLWQGVPIRSMRRSLDVKSDWENTGSFATTGITWGRYIDTDLAEARELGGISCGAGVVSWDFDADGELAWSEADAAGPVPEGFLMERCISAGQTVHSADKTLTFRLPAQGSLWRERMVGTDFPRGHEDFWQYRAASAEIPVPADEFALTDAEIFLQRQNLQLYEFHGTLATATAACPLPPGTRVYWHHRRAKILQADAVPLPPRCGVLSVEAMQR